MTHSPNVDVVQQRKKSFRLHHIPGWFSNSIKRASKFYDWDTDYRSQASWWALHELCLQIVGNSHFDHFGSVAASSLKDRHFVTQPYGDFENIEDWATMIATILDIRLTTVDLDSSWGSGTIWVEWEA